jgi:hypothetical protein
MKPLKIKAYVRRGPLLDRRLDLWHLLSEEAVLMNAIVATWSKR